MQEELHQFERNKVWHLVPRPNDRSIIDTKWVFKNKLDEFGTVTWNKARLVVQGYNQEEKKHLRHGSLFLDLVWYLGQPRNNTLLHIDIHRHFLRDNVGKSLISMNFCAIER